MGVSFDWAEISKSNKGVRTSDNKACGVVVSIAGDDMRIVDGAISIKRYSIPKSQIKFYNGSELFLKIPSSLIKEYEY